MSLWMGLAKGFAVCKQEVSPFLSFAGRQALGVWHLLIRNRLAIAIASLAWLIYRSGTQPRRLSYPCQQVAVLNVGAVAAGLIPALFFWRKPHCPKAALRAATIRRQLVAAGLMFLVALVGIESYQYAESVVPPQLPQSGPEVKSPPSTLVGIAQVHPNRSVILGAAEIEGLVRLAVARAGGLDGLIHDGDTVVLKPNLVALNFPVGGGVATNVHVTNTVVKMVKEAANNVTVKIAEGCAWSNGGNDIHGVTAEAYRQYGYDASPQDGWFDLDPTVQLVDLNDTGGKDQHVGVTQVNIAGVLRNTYWVPNVLLNCNVLISIPTFKNHSNGTITLGIKNRMGCAPGDIYYNRDGTYQPLKRGLHFTDYWSWTVPPAPANENETVRRTIVDLNLVRPQDFVVIDGLVGNTAGPCSFDTPSPYMQMIMASRDTVAIDTAGALAMGYDPQYITQITYAAGTGVLGTNNTSAITVVGDRVAVVRQDFPINSTYDGVRAESVAPTLNTFSVNEGDIIIGDETVTIEDFDDNVGVVKAELAATVLGPNLVQNGGFEAAWPEDGWTRWWAGWTQEMSISAYSEEPGRIGSRCLRLGSSLSMGSFGLYQEVAVEPGKTYRCDAYWKGQKVGNMNWFELLLLDGPWDPQKADSGSPASEWVEPNYILAYDNNTYGLPGPVGTTFGWIWGHRQWAPPVKQVDWNNRRGQRTASGNVMTVVLKAGSTTPGMACWFDEISLREVVGEYVTDTVPNPTDPVALKADASILPPSGPNGYDAELRATVYDAAMNEASQIRNVVIKTVPPVPWVCREPSLLTHTLNIGEVAANNPPDDTFEVWNCGSNGALNYTITVDWKGAAPWFTVVPPNGVSQENPTSTNLHTIDYNCAGMLPGTHEAIITVQGPSNARQITVRVTLETVKPDWDYDGDVDQDDFAHLQACLTGNGILIPAGPCSDADLDGDNDADLYDVVKFQGCKAGADQPVDKNCLNN